MKMQIRGVGRDSQKFEDQNLKRLYFLVDCIQDVANTAPATTNIDLSKLQISMKLNQLGMEMTSSFNAIAPPIVGAQLYGYQSVDALNYDSSGITCAGVTVVPASSGVKARTLLVIPLIFNPLILKDDDFLSLDFEIMSGFFSSDCDTDSKVYIVSEDGTDLHQMDMQLPVYQSLNNVSPSQQFSFSAINSMCLIDSGGTDVITDTPIQRVDLKSSFMQEKYDTVDLIAKNLQNLSSPYSTHNNNFRVVDCRDSALDSVKLNIDLNTSLITQNNQFLFVNEVRYNAALTARAGALTHKINGRKVQYRVNKGY